MLQIFLTIIIGLILIILLLKKINKEKNFPPGPFQWPILGSIPQMIMEDSSSYFHKQTTGMVEKYGGIMSFGYGTQYAVLVSDYAIIKDLFRRPETNAIRFKFDFMKPRSRNKNLGIIWSEGDVWKEQRKFTMKLLRQFGIGRKFMIDNIESEVNDFVAEIKEEIQKSNGIWEVKFNRIGLSSINILWASVSGIRFDTKCPKIQRHVDLHNEVFESIGVNNLLAPFPFLKIFPKLSGYDHICKLQETCREFTDELIADAKDQWERQDRAEPESFIEAYLKEIENNKFNPNTNFTEEQLSLILMDLFVGGSDTSSSALNWIILYLALFPQVQSKARDEINLITKQQHESGSNTQPSLTSTPFIRAVILETMRHAPYLPVSTPRSIKEDIKCGGYTIPKGACLFQNFYFIFHDPKFWTDPENFRPERFFTPDGLTLDSEKVDRIIQFGSGARICPGEDLAMATMFKFTIGLLKNFVLETIPGQPPSLEPIAPSLVTKPKPFSLHVKVID